MQKKNIEQVLYMQDSWTELKGIKTLVEAWKIMGKNAPHLIICGTGPLEEWCKNEIHGLNVEMKGFVNNEAVKQMIAQLLDYSTYSVVRRLSDDNS